MDSRSETQIQDAVKYLILSFLINTYKILHNIIFDN